MENLARSIAPLFAAAAAALTPGCTCGDVTGEVVGGMFKAAAEQAAARAKARRERERRNPTPGRAAFKAADRTLGVAASSTEGDRARGNSAPARRVAAKMAKRVREELADSFERVYRPHHRVRVYCHLGEQARRVALLVRVPRLRRIRGTARRALLSLLWSHAIDAVNSELDAVAARGLQLALGLRGALLYGAVATGKAKRGSLPTTKQIGRAVRRARLYPFFADKPMVLGADRDVDKPERRHASAGKPFAVRSTFSVGVEPATGVLRRRDLRTTKSIEGHRDRSPAALHRVYLVGGREYVLDVRVPRAATRRDYGVEAEARVYAIDPRGKTLAQIERRHRPHTRAWAPASRDATRARA